MKRKVRREPAIDCSSGIYEEGRLIAAANRSKAYIERASLPSTPDLHGW